MTPSYYSRKYGKLIFNFLCLQTLILFMMMLIGANRGNIFLFRVITVDNKEPRLGCSYELWT